MNLTQLGENSLYFLALINPISKVLFIVAKSPAYSRTELINLALKSSIVAFVLLALLASLGDLLLVKLFRVEIYSLSVAGGIILFNIGLSAVKSGCFFEPDRTTKHDADFSVVPLAAPLIAGPGTMTAAISFASIQGAWHTIGCIMLASIINLVCMLLSFQINKVITRFKATEPLIRITGLIVTAVAMQMIFSGCSTWWQTIR